MLSLNECVWDFQNNKFWDTHQHAIVAHFSYGYAFYNKSVNQTGDFPYIRYVIQNGRGMA